MFFELRVYIPVGFFHRIVEKIAAKARRVGNEADVFALEAFQAFLEENFGRILAALFGGGFFLFGESGGRGKHHGENREQQRVQPGTARRYTGTGEIRLKKYWQARYQG